MFSCGITLDLAGDQEAAPPTCTARSVSISAARLLRSSATPEAPTRRSSKSTQLFSRSTAHSTWTRRSSRGISLRSPTPDAPRARRGAWPPRSRSGTRDQKTCAASPSSGARWQHRADRAGTAAGVREPSSGGPSCLRRSLRRRSLRVVGHRGVQVGGRQGLSSDRHREIRGCPDGRRLQVRRISARCRGAQGPKRT